MARPPSVTGKLDAGSPPGGGHSAATAVTPVAGSSDGLGVTAGGGKCSERVPAALPTFPACKLHLRVLY